MTYIGRIRLPLAEYDLYWFIVTLTGRICSQSKVFCRSALLCRFNIPCCATCIFVSIRSGQKNGLTHPTKIESGRLIIQHMCNGPKHGKLFARILLEKNCKNLAACYYYIIYKNVIIRTFLVNLWLWHYCCLFREHLAIFGWGEWQTCRLVLLFHCNLLLCVNFCLICISLYIAAISAPALVVIAVISKCLARNLLGILYLGNGYLCNMFSTFGWYTIWITSIE